jgi:hypothetical protein
MWRKLHLQNLCALQRGLLPNAVLHKFIFFMFVIIISFTHITISLIYTGQFKKMVTLSHAYDEVTSEPTITRYASIVRKALKVLIYYLTNTQCGNPVSHGTRQSDSPFLSRLSPACPVYSCHSGDDAMSQFLKIIWQGWYVDDVLDIPQAYPYPAETQLLQSWSSQTTGYRTPFAVESPFCNTVSPGGGRPKHFPASIRNKRWEFS